MPAIDLIPPALEPAPPRHAPTDPPPKGTEQFATFMGRALAHSWEGDDSGASDEPPPGDRKPDRAKPAGSTDAPSTPTPTGAENLMITPPPPPAAPQSPAGSNTDVEPVSANSVPTETNGEANAASLVSQPDAGMADAKSAADDSNLAEELSTSSDKTAVNPASKSTSSATKAPSLETTGISGAKYHLAMQKAENTNNFSGSTEQNLPVEAANSPGVELPAQAINPAALHHDKAETLPLAAASTISGTATSAEISTAAAVVEWPSSARSLERTHDLMSLHAVQFKDSGEQSLRIVIKPDAGLQLSLNLQMRDGNVEMRAMLHRGNFEFLNLHWTELQQQLESRGIRLAPLTLGDPTADGGNLFEQPNQQSSRENMQANGAFAEFALNSTLVPTPAKPGAPAPRGWESWA